MTHVRSALWQQTHRDVAREVEEVITLYHDGRPFFDEMDRRMREKYVQVAYTLAQECYGAQLVTTSGRFGDELNRQLAPSDLLRFPGGLRYVDPPPMHIPTGKVYVFIDDSCYKGRTFRRVASAITAAGSLVIGAFILYDGAAEAIPGIVSLYRWRDRPSFA